MIHGDPNAAKLGNPHVLHEVFSAYNVGAVSNGAFRLSPHKMLCFRVFHRALADIAELLSATPSYEFGEKTLEKDRDPATLYAWVYGKHAFGLENICTVIGWEYKKVLKLLLPFLERIPPLPPPTPYRTDHETHCRICAAPITAHPKAVHKKQYCSRKCCSAAYNMRREPRAWK